jgi:hypothetical protein
MDYKKKYEKYKMRYLDLKKNIGGRWPLSRRRPQQMDYGYVRQPQQRRSFFSHQQMPIQEEPDLGMGWEPDISNPYIQR